MKHDVVVVGGGQAGLAMGYHLQRRGSRFVILDAADSIGDAWRSRWDSLTLFTPARYSALPGLRFPAEPEHLPHRDEVAAYIQQYAHAFSLPVRSGERVHTVRPCAGGGFIVASSEDSYEAKSVVIATGAFQLPFIPQVAGEARIVQLHSSEYRNPAQLPTGPVAVVGAGNSGVQIAEELAVTRPTTLAVGNRLKRLPQRFLGRSIFWWLSRSGALDAPADSWIGRRMRAHDTLIGSSPEMIARHVGVRLGGRVTAIRGDVVHTADGAQTRAAAVIWATGFRPGYDFIHAPVFDSAGSPVHRRGITSQPGLVFLGLPWQHSRGSALLGGVGDDAAFLAQHLSTTRNGAVMPLSNPDRVPNGTRRVGVNQELGISGT